MQFFQELDTTRIGFHFIDIAVHVAVISYNFLHHKIIQCINIEKKAINKNIMLFCCCFKFRIMLLAS